MKKIVIGGVILLLLIGAGVYFYPKTQVLVETVEQTSTHTPTNVVNENEITHIFSGKVIEKIGTSEEGEQFHVRITNDSGITTKGDAKGVVIINNSNPNIHLISTGSIEFNFTTHYNSEKGWYEVLKAGPYIID